MISNSFFKAINEEVIFHSFDTYWEYEDGNVFYWGMRGSGRRPHSPFSTFNIILS